MQTQIRRQWRSFLAKPRLRGEAPKVPLCVEMVARAAGHVALDFVDNGSRSRRLNPVKERVGQRCGVTCKKIGATAAKILHFFPT
jgi:hypothetical protein